MSEGYTLTGGVHGGSCAVTVWIHESPVVTVGIAPHSRCCGTYLWRWLHDEKCNPYMPLVTQRAEPPSDPWCAVRLETGAFRVPIHDLALLADLERCLAWTWFELCPTCSTC
jgi:hypothetical protein